MFCPIRDHLLCRELCGEIQAEDVDREQVAMIFVGEIEERKMSVYPSAWNADIEGIVEVLLELSEAILKGLLRRDIHP